MKKNEVQKLEHRLISYYAGRSSGDDYADRASSDGAKTKAFVRDDSATKAFCRDDADLTALVSAMLEADALGEGAVGTPIAARSRSTAQFREPAPVSSLASQARMMPWWVWAVQLVFLGLSTLLSLSDAGVAFTYSAVGVFVSLVVLTQAPIAYASRTYRMSELERSCRHDFAGVMFARLLILGCSQALCMAVAAAALSAEHAQGFAAPFLYLCLPYFCSCAGCLWLLRRESAQEALLWCCAWVVGCCGASLLLGVYAPSVYEAGSFGAWALAAAAAGAWLARELRRTIEEAAGGISALASNDERRGRSWS